MFYISTCGDGSIAARNYLIASAAPIPEKDGVGFRANV
jgi:hypothetical protein